MAVKSPVLATDSLNSQAPLVTPSSPASRKTSNIPEVSLISADTFIRASKLEGSRCFSINLKVDEASGRFLTPESEPLADLEGVPAKYHDFMDIFSKQKANKLAPHRPYDLKININEGTHPPLGLIYPLSQSELSAIHEFLDEHLSIGFIRPTKSPYRAPVLFIKKKDSSLRLCVDFCSLNAITQKDKYPLLLITDLLDAPRVACIYTKIDLKQCVPPGPHC
jgi:hypothetical protein